MDARPIAIVLFAFTFWLGGYLITRNPAKAAMQLAGWGVMAYALAVALSILAPAFESDALRLLQRVASALPALLWVLALISLFRRRSDAAPRRPLGLLFIGAIFFALSLVLFVLDLFPPFWALVLIGIDLGLLGVALARLDAFDEGETFGRDMARSLAGSGLMAALFGSAVVIAASASGGLTGVMLALTFVVIALAIDVQLFAPRLQAWLDRLILPARVQQQRAALRETGEALARADDALNVMTLSEAEFAKLTRRALSHMTDLPKLAASPLTRLPAVEHHLEAHGMPDSPLDRASALRAVLTQHIARLKPNGEAFGTSDAWRHYNALHFPYVVGLKPYSTRAAINGHNGLDQAHQEALAWFQSAVPERTLHNWQNTAAKVIAAALKQG
jgi:hypothetical protein